MGGENSDLKKHKLSLEQQKAATEAQNGQLLTDVATLTDTNTGLVTANGKLKEFNGKLIEANAQSAAMMQKMKIRNRHKSSLGNGGLSSLRAKNDELRRQAELKRKAERAERPAGATGSPRAGSRSPSPRLGDDQKAQE